MKVPPPRFDVNVGLVRLTDPSVTKVDALAGASGSVTVTFDDWMQVGSVTKRVTVTDSDGRTLDGTVTPLDAKTSPGGVQLATQFRFTPTAALPAGQVTVSVDPLVRDYADHTLADAFEQTVTASTSSHSSGAPAPSTGPFPDVPASGQFSADIAWLVARHITSGYADGGFHPGAAVSRQAMAAFLYRESNPGKADPACRAALFPDVPVSSAFCGDVAWLVARHITSGYADGGFHPGAAVSRQAMAAFLHRRAGAG
jgi:hypothetical protein